MEPIQYECKENDNKIKVFFKDDGRIDELHFTDELKDVWFVFGYNDVASCFDRAGYGVGKITSEGESPPLLKKQVDKPPCLVI